MLRNIFYLVLVILLCHVPRLSANENVGTTPQLREELTKTLITTANVIEKQGITDSEQSCEIQAIAMSLARLGKIVEARQTARKMIIRDNDVTNGIPYTLRYINRVTLLRETG